MARRRSHPAAATRIFLAGLTTASMLGIVSALAFAEPPATVTAPVATSVTPSSTPPPTIVLPVYRYVQVPAAGGSSGGTTPRVTSSGSATPAPTPAPAPAAPQPVTQTRAS